MKFRDLAAVAFLALSPRPAIVEPARSWKGGDPAAFSTIRRMGRRHILGYDGVWKGRQRAVSRPGFRTHRKAGFTHVRIQFLRLPNMSVETGLTDCPRASRQIIDSRSGTG